MNHLGDTNKMVSETPRTDKAIWNRLDRSWMDGTLCRQLERELNAEKQHVTELENRLRALWDKYDGDRNHYMDRIKRLEEAGDRLAAFTPPSADRIAQWNKSKEAKP